jgi:hypothetical protein
MRYRYSKRTINMIISKGILPKEISRQTIRSYKLVKRLGELYTTE